jgi:sec-independent protein translocase protein TatA
MNVILAVFGLGGGELIIVLGAVLVLFGAKKIPEFARGLGQGMKEFKKASREVSDELQNAVDTDAPPTPPKRIAAPDEATEAASRKAMSKDAEFKDVNVAAASSPSGTVPKAP